MKEFTTMEKLQMKVSATYGSVLKFGDHVLVTDACYKGGFTADTSLWKRRKKRDLVTLNAA